MSEENENVAQGTILPPDDPTVRRWEQQSDESSEAFAAFQLFRDTPPENRTIRLCIELYYVSITENEKRKLRARWSRWSKNHFWMDRVAAWEREKDRRMQAVQMEENLAMRKRHAYLAQQLQARALEALQQLDPNMMRPEDILDFMEKATQIERLARGEPAAIQQYRVAQGEANPSSPVGDGPKIDHGYDDEEIMKLARTLRTVDQLQLMGPDVPAGEDPFHGEGLDGEEE